MTTKHTPGPWIASFDETTDEGGMPVRAIDPSDGLRFRVADVYGIDCDTHHCDVSKANARLIAAAPELLEALVKLSNAYAFSKPPGYPKADVEKMAEAAIAKATGEQA